MDIFIPTPPCGLYRKKLLRRITNEISSPNLGARSMLIAQEEGPAITENQGVTSEALRQSSC